MNKEIWIDVTDLNEKKAIEIIGFSLNIGYSGIHLDFKQIVIIDKLPKNIKLLIKVTNENKDALRKYIKENKDRRIIPLLTDFDKKFNFAFEDMELGIFISINDKKSMEKAIELSKKYKTIVIQFESVTNIPLELILAYSQKYNNTICKLINNSEDGWIATMTMEMGSQAVLIKSDDIEDISKLKKNIDSLSQNSIKVEELKVFEVKHIGMGDRVCVDTITKLDEDEAISLGCDAVSVHINLGNEYEASMLEDVGGIAGECNRKGMPLVAMVYVRGSSIKDGRELEYLKRAVRLADESGADIVKVNHSLEGDDFSEVVNACQTVI